MLRTMLYALASKTSYVACVLPLLAATACAGPNEAINNGGSTNGEHRAVVGATLTVEKVVLHVQDANKMAKFYGAVLDASPEVAAPNFGAWRLANVHGGLELEFWPGAREHSVTHRLCVNVEGEDLGVTLERALASGGNCDGGLEITTNGMRAVVRDPEGGEIELHGIASADNVRRHAVR